MRAWLTLQHALHKLLLYNTLSLNAGPGGDVEATAGKHGDAGDCNMGSWNGLHQLAYASML